MQDRNALRLITERWRVSLATKRGERSDDPRLSSQIEQVEQSLAETEDLIAECRRRRAAFLRTLRRLSRTLGVETARPLPRCPGSVAFPTSGGDYGIRHFTTPAGPCVVCAGEAGSGPVGWRKGEEPGPICVDCLMQVDRRIAWVTRLAHLLREAGEVECVSKEEEASLSSLLMAIVVSFKANHFDGLPMRRVEGQWTLPTLLARLRARYQAENGERGGDGVGN